MMRKEMKMNIHQRNVRRHRKQSSRIVSESKDVPSPRISQSMKLTDLNIDCLESIFRHLTLKDLLNVVDTNSDLRPAVDIVYRHQHGKKTEDIKLNIFRKSGKKPLDKRFDHIQINDLKTTFQVLRIFGDLVKHIQWTGNDKIKQSVDLFRYINKYCAENLAQLSLSRITSDVLLGHLFDKPFLNLTKINFSKTYLCGDLTQFNRWFPRLKALAFMKDVKLVNPKCIKINFLSLEGIQLCRSIPKKYVELLFQFNPQLNGIHFYCDYAGKLLKTAREYLPNVKYLNICWEREGHEHIGMIAHMDSNDFYFKKLEKLRIFLETESGAIRYENEFAEDDEELFEDDIFVDEFFDHDFFDQEFFDDQSIYEDEPSLLPIEIPITFGPIKEFHISSAYPLGTKFLEFLSRHRSIQSLFVDAPEYSVDDFVEKIPTLKEITFPNAKLQLPGVVDFMDRHQSLQKFGGSYFSNISDENLRTDNNIYVLENIAIDNNLSICQLKRVQTVQNAVENPAQL